MHVVSFDASDTIGLNCRDWGRQTPFFSHFERVKAKRVAIVQSSYIPWKGYFDLIRHVDEFILYDDAQFTKRDWRSRNRIKMANGALWLTVPVEVSGKYRQCVKDARISDPGWNQRHWRSIRASYARAPFFDDYKDALEQLYLECRTPYLSEVNHCFISALCALMSIETRLTWSMDYDLPEGRTERLVAMCQQACATEYVSGPTARAYMDMSLFESIGLPVRFIDYGRYPEYPQLYPPFDHQVSIIDLLLHTGPEATRYMLSTLESAAPPQPA